MSKFKMSEKKSLCCNANMKLDVKISDVGVCSKCNKFAFNRDSQNRLSKNRHQNFKKIADDGLYNNSWNKKPANYRALSKK